MPARSPSLSSEDEKPKKKHKHRARSPSPRPEKRHKHKHRHCSPESPEERHRKHKTHKRREKNQVSSAFFSTIREFLVCIKCRWFTVVDPVYPTGWLQPYNLPFFEKTHENLEDYEILVNYIGAPQIHHWFR